MKVVPDVATIVRQPWDWDLTAIHELSVNHPGITPRGEGPVESILVGVLG